MHTISVGVRPVNRASPIPNEYMNGLLFETTHSGISGILLQNDPGCRGTHRVSHIRLAETKRFNSDQILHAMRAGPGSSDVEPGSSSTRWSREDAGAASNAGGSCSSPSFSQGAANGPRDGRRRPDEMRIRARSCARNWRKVVSAVAVRRALPLRGKRQAARRECGAQLLDGVRPDAVEPFDLGLAQLGNLPRAKPAEQAPRARSADRSRAEYTTLCLS